MAGERLWTVDPLSTGPKELSGSNPDLDELAAIPAVALFVARAKAADPTFAFDTDTAPLVVEICRRLDGIPLAIELAAARARAIGVAEIAHRLDERFGLLKAMRRGSDPRHRTMHDAISWSYDMLEPEERELFTALSVFAGSFDLRSAEALAPGGDALDLLTRLTERSMLAVRPRAGGSTRYELLETLREYGRTRLGDARAAELFAAHAKHFAAEAGAVEAELQGPGERAGIARAESSFADLRAAQRFALELGALDIAFGLIGSIREFAMRAMRYEVFAWADCRLPGTGSARSPAGPAADRHARLRRVGAGRVRPRRTARRGDAPPRTPAVGLSQRPRRAGPRQRAVHRGRLARPATLRRLRQIELAEESGNRSRLVHACYMGAVAHSSDGDYDEANGLVRRAHELAERTASRPTGVGGGRRGFASRTEDEALEAFTVGGRAARAAGNRWMSAFALTEASGLLVSRGELEVGCAGLAEMVGLWYRAGDWSQQWHTLSRCVIALHRIGNAELAVELLGAIETHATLGVAPMSTDPARCRVRHPDELVDALGEPIVLASCWRLVPLCPVEDIVLRTRRALIGAELSAGPSVIASVGARARVAPGSRRGARQRSAASRPVPPMRFDRRRRRNGRPSR